MRRGFFFLLLPLAAASCADRVGQLRVGSIAREAEPATRPSFFTDWQNLSQVCEPWVPKTGVPTLTPQHWEAAWLAFALDPRADRITTGERDEISRRAFERTRNEIRAQLRTTSVKAGAGILGRMLMMYGNAPGYEVRHLEAIRSRILREPPEGGPCTTVYLSLLYSSLLQEIDPFFAWNASKAAKARPAQTGSLLHWKMETRSFGDSLIVRAVSKEQAEDMEFDSEDTESLEGVGTIEQLAEKITDVRPGSTVLNAMYWIFDLRGWSQAPGAYSKSFATLKLALENALPLGTTTRLPWVLLWRDADNLELLPSFLSMGGHWRLLHARGICGMPASQVQKAGLPAGYSWVWGCQDDLKDFPYIGGKRDRKLISGNLPPDAREYISARLTKEGSTTR